MKLLLNIEGTAYYLNNLLSGICDHVPLISAAVIQLVGFQLESS